PGIHLYDPATNQTRTPGPTDHPLDPAQALVFWLTALSKNPLRPLSETTTDRQLIFDFDMTRVVRTRSSGPVWKDYYEWPTNPTPLKPVTVAVGGKPHYRWPKWNPGRYFPRDGDKAPYIYLEARQYLVHAIVSAKNPVTPNFLPYLLEPWDANRNGILD